MEESLQAAGLQVERICNGWLILTGEQINLLIGRQGVIKAFLVFGGPAVVVESTLETVKSILGL